MAEKDKETPSSKQDQTPKPSKPPASGPPSRSTYIKEDRGVAWDSQLPAVKDTAEPPPPTEKKGG
jgi:hypothetical protein